jgi:hypothetical protein
MFLCPQYSRAKSKNDPKIFPHTFLSKSAVFLPFLENCVLPDA